MEVKVGQFMNYFWIETSSDYFTTNRFVQNFSKFIIDKNLAIVSFDGDSFLPTNDELERGWIYKNEIAYFDKISIEELNKHSFNFYDQWLIFNNQTQINSVNIFVTFEDFSVSFNSDNKDPLKTSITNKFWLTIEQIRPLSFLICGDNFIYGSNSKWEIEEIKKVLLI